MKHTSFHESIQHVRSLLDSCEFDSALESIQLIESNSASELRTMGHMVGKISYRQGKYQDALKHYQNAEAAYGEYIGLTCDIAAAHYMLENFEAFEIETKRAIATLKKNRALLSPETLMRSSLSLSKFSEELGAIAEAVEISEQALTQKTTEASGALESVRLMIQAQLLRLHAQFYSPHERLRTHYRALLQLSQNKSRLFHHVDVQHALMLAEFHLLSPEQAVRRLQVIVTSATTPQGNETDPSASQVFKFESPLMSEADLRLCYFDLMAEGLLKKTPLGSDFPRIQFEHLTEFEEAILKHQTGSVESTAANGVLPLAQRLVLLSLVLDTSSAQVPPSRSKVETTRDASKRQLGLLLSTLSIEDQTLWKKRLTQNMKASENLIQYDPISGRLSYGASSLTLNGQTLKILFESLFKAKLQGVPIATAELAEAIWQETYTLSHYERLRVSSRRLNSSLQKITGLKENLVFTKSNVSLKPELNFESTSHF